MFEVESRFHYLVTVVELRGVLILSAVATKKFANNAELALDSNNPLAPVAEYKSKGLIVDCQHLERVDSMGVAEIERVARLMEKNQKPMRLCSVNDQVLEYFQANSQILPAMVDATLDISIQNHFPDYRQE